jgi:hypothetical protein
LRLDYAGDYPHAGGAGQALPRKQAKPHKTAQKQANVA